MAEAEKRRELLFTGGGIHEVLKELQTNKSNEKQITAVKIWWTVGREDDTPAWFLLQQIAQYPQICSLEIANIRFKHSGEALTTLLESGQIKHLKITNSSFRLQRRERYVCAAFWYLESLWIGLTRVSVIRDMCRVLLDSPHLKELGLDGYVRNEGELECLCGLLSTKTSLQKVHLHLFMDREQVLCCAASFSAAPLSAAAFSSLSAPSAASFSATDSAFPSKFAFPFSSFRSHSGGGRITTIGGPRFKYAYSYTFPVLVVDIALAFCTLLPVYLVLEIAYWRIAWVVIEKISLEKDVTYVSAVACRDAVEAVLSPQRKRAVQAIESVFAVRVARSAS